MALNNLIMKGYDLHGRLFSYMFPYPITANKQTRRLSLNISQFWKLLPWFLMMILLFVQGYGTSFYLIITELFRRRKHVSLLNFIIFIVAGTMYWVTFGLNTVTLLYAQEAVSGSNQLLDLQMRMVERFPLQQVNVPPTRQLNVRGLVVLNEVVVASICPLSFTVVGVFVDLDPLYFLLRDILPDIYYWDTETILTCLCLRLCTLFVGAQEVARSLSLAVAFFITGLDVYINITKILLRMNRQHFMLYYTQFRLAHYIFKNFVDRFMACSLSSSFVILVCLLWFTIQSYGRIHWFIYMGFVVVVTFLIVVTLLCFPQVVELYESTRAVVRKWKLISRTRWDFKRVGKREGRAQAPLYFSCHCFYPFKRSSLRTFYSTVMEYWFTSVILVHF